MCECLEEYYEELNEELDNTCPSYYNKVVQPWDYMQANFSAPEFRGYLKGNVLKYLSRYQEKGGIADLYKMRAYQEKLIEWEEGLNGV